MSALEKALRAEIALYRRDERESFGTCGPDDEALTYADAEARTHGQVAANHADRLDLMLEDPAAYLATAESELGHVGGGQGGR